MNMVANKRFQVFSLKTGRNGTIWVRAGSAWLNRDGSINVYLDVLPLDGKLHIREPLETKTSTPPDSTGPSTWKVIADFGVNPEGERYVVLDCGHGQYWRGAEAFGKNVDSTVDCCTKCAAGDPRVDFCPLCLKCTEYENFGVCKYDPGAGKIAPKEWGGRTARQR